MLVFLLLLLVGFFMEQQLLANIQVQQCIFYSLSVSSVWYSRYAFHFGIFSELHIN